MKFSYDLGGAKMITEKIKGLTEVLQDVENFYEAVNVNFTELQKIKIYNIQKRRANYYNELSQNAVECAKETSNEYLKSVLLQRAEKYKQVSKSFISLEEKEIFYKDISLYKRINARTRKLIEAIAKNLTNKITESLEFTLERKTLKETSRSIYNMAMISLLTKSCVGNHFLTILPQNYYKEAI